MRFRDYFAVFMAFAAVACSCSGAEVAWQVMPETPFDATPVAWQVMAPTACNWQVCECDCTKGEECDCEDCKCKPVAKPEPAKPKEVAKPATKKLVGYRTERQRVCTSRGCHYVTVKVPVYQ